MQVRDVYMSNDRLKRETIILLEAVKGKKWRVVGIIKDQFYLGILKEAEIEKHFLPSSLFPYIAARTLLAHPDCEDQNLRELLQGIYKEDEMAKTKEAAEAKAAAKPAKKEKPTAATANVKVPATGKAPKAKKEPKLDADGNPIKATKKVYPKVEYKPEQKVTFVTDPNPKRGASAERFAHYKVGLTLAQCVEKGVSKGDLQWDLARGLIKI